MIFRILALAWAMMLFLGCASVSPPYSEPAQPDSESDIGSDTELKPKRAPVRPDARQQVDVATESDAIKHLLDKAEQALEIDDQSRAQALSDRALRIERTSARAYLIAAIIQFGYENFSIAEDLARQGLLYAPKNSSVGQRLVSLLDQVQN